MHIKANILVLDRERLQLMLDEIANSESIYRPSDFWQRLNNNHIDALVGGNINNFKRTVNKHYFHWGTFGILIHQLSPILSEIARGHLDILFKSRFPGSYNLLYKSYVAALYEYMLKVDSKRLLSRLREPRVGNPPLVYYKGKYLSQDLCNSVHEFYSITENTKLKKNASILELGAGYGRLAFVFLKTMPKISYTIIDIPPALYIAQEYLSRVFPREKIFYFRHFNTFKEVTVEFKKARIRFLTANQIELLPAKAFDVIITISSLHEMTRAQIKNYIHQFDRLSKGYFYIKQWIKSRTADNQYIRREEYPTPKKCEVVFDGVHPIQKMFFEALYKVN